METKELDSQGFVQDLLLFLIYINDLDLGMKCLISKLEEDTMAAYTVKSIEGCMMVQKDLNNLLGVKNENY